ncbi:MAG: hypothetical protein JRC77_07760 [Deltaproteobacteria bacterium]|nr:hypothetical protein [Deltaproteobacteria bacterium]
MNQHMNQHMKRSTQKPAGLETVDSKSSSRGLATLILLAALLLAPGQSEAFPFGLLNSHDRNSDSDLESEDSLSAYTEAARMYDFMRVAQDAGLPYPFLFYKPWLDIPEPDNSRGLLQPKYNTDGDSGDEDGSAFNNRNARSILFYLPPPPKPNPFEGYRRTLNPFVYPYPYDPYFSSGLILTSVGGRMVTWSNTGTVPFYLPPRNNYRLASHWACQV